MKTTNQPTVEIKIQINHLTLKFHKAKPHGFTKRFLESINHQSTSRSPTCCAFTKSLLWTHVRKSNTPYLGYNSKRVKRFNWDEWHTWNQANIWKDSKILNKSSTLSMWWMWKKGAPIVLESNALYIISIRLKYVFLKWIGVRIFHWNQLFWGSMRMPTTHGLYKNNALGTYGLSTQVLAQHPTGNKKSIYPARQN